MHAWNRSKAGGRQVAAASQNPKFLPPLAQGQTCPSCRPLSAEEESFLALLNEDLSNFNDFFIEKEEDSVIRLQSLTDELTSSRVFKDEEQMQQLKARLVDFHGEKGGDQDLMQVRPSRYEPPCEALKPWIMSSSVPAPARHAAAQGLPSPHASLFI